MEAVLTRGLSERCEAAPERALPEIRRRLCSAGYYALREIECEYDDGVVVLRGRVSTYYLKQVAQAAVLSDPAIERVLNLIEVSSNGNGASRRD